MIRASFFWLVGFVCLADWLARMTFRRAIAGPRFWRLALAWQGRLLVPNGKTVRGVVERTNKDGVKVSGAWYNYGRVFKGDRLAKEAVGRLVDLALVYSSQDDKWLIRAITWRIPDRPPASTEKPRPSAPPPEEEGVLETGEPDSPSEPASDTSIPSASPEALKYAEDLALGEGWTSEELEALAEKRFKKPIAELGPEEASKLIEFFGGYRLTSQARARS